MKLHHTVIGTLAEEHAKSIEIDGLIPYVAGAYKDLVPKKIRHLPVVWFAEGIWQGWEFPIFEVDSRDLDNGRLFRLKDKAAKDVHWWVYQGEISPNVIFRVQIPSPSRSI